MHTPRAAGGTVPLLNVTLVPAPDQVVVRLTGDADMSTAPLITDALAQAARLGRRQVVVDVAPTLFWDCSGLNALLAFTAEFDSAGRSCRIVGAPARTRRLLQVADLTDRLHLDGPVTPRTGSRTEPHGVPAPVRTAVPTRQKTSGHPVPVRARRSAMALGARRSG